MGEWAEQNFLLWITLDYSGLLWIAPPLSRQRWPTKFTTKLAILVADIPPGSWTRYTVTTPANIEDSCGPGCYKPATRVLQAATTCDQGQAGGAGPCLLSGQCSKILTARPSLCGSLPTPGSDFLPGFDPLHRLLGPLQEGEFQAVWHSGKRACELLQWKAMSNQPPVGPDGADDPDGAGGVNDSQGDEIPPMRSQSALNLPTGARFQHQCALPLSSH